MLKFLLICLLLPGDFRQPQAEIDEGYPRIDTIGGLDYITFQLTLLNNNSLATQFTSTIYVQSFDCTINNSYTSNPQSCNQIESLTYKQYYSPQLGQDYIVWFTITFLDSQGRVVATYTYNYWYVDAMGDWLNIDFVGP